MKAPTSDCPISDLCDDLIAVPWYLRYLGIHFKHKHFNSLTSSSRLNMLK